MPLEGSCGAADTVECGLSGSGDKRPAESSSSRPAVQSTGVVDISNS